MTDTTYVSRLASRIRSLGTPSLIGLDPRWELLPEEIRQEHSRGSRDARAAAFAGFCREIIDLVAPLVPAVKPQVAFFEQLGPAGLEALQDIMQHARSRDLIVIADAKRGDIGSTASAYADAWLDGTSGQAAFPADAVTVSPYLGPDTLQPFIETAIRRNAGLYVLVRTSNPEAGVWQDRRSDNTTVFEAVADTLENLNQTLRGQADLGPVGAVVGATWPEELAALRRRMPTTPLLVPGYGSQGGTAGDVAAAFSSHAGSALINSSRAINFAWHRSPWKEQFGERRWREAVTAATQQMIEDLRHVCPSGA